MKEDSKGSYIYLAAQPGLCGYVTLINKQQQQIVLEAYLYDGNQEKQKLGHFNWEKPSDKIQFSFDSAGTSNQIHYRIYCYSRFSTINQKSDSKNLVIIDANTAKTRASCGKAAPWAGGREGIPYKPLCMDVINESSECKK